ncbi:MAG: hypothetical protein JSU92_02995, partial [Deltaproteobacteria bacterium]
MSFKLKGGMAAAAFVLVALLAVTPAIAGDVYYGDANLSGAVDGADAGVVQQGIIGSLGVPPNADASGHDAAIKVSDVLAIQQLIAFYRADLPVVAPPSVNAIEDITGPANVIIPLDSTMPVTLNIVTSITPPRGNLSCAGIVVDFTCNGCPPGGSVDSPAVADASCQVTTTLTCGPNSGIGSLTATITLRRPSGAVVGTVTNTVAIGLEFGGTCSHPVPGAPVLILSLPRDGASNLPPDSVTQNMPVDAYLKFVYDQDVDISGATLSGSAGGSLALETTNYTNDTVAWYGPGLSYETDYTLGISGVVDCDEGNPAPAINLSLRTAREVTAADVGQNGEGFLDGMLTVRVVNDVNEVVLTEAVVQINTSVTWDDPGWAKEVQAYTGGTITFMSAVVPLNQPITITVMAPGYEYLTFTGLDAREVVLGLRYRGLGVTNLQETDIIGDFPPAGFDSIHAYNARSVDVPNPVRFGMASFGFFRRTLTTLETKDIFGPNVWQTLTIIGQSMGMPLPCNIHLPDMVSAREDIPTGGTGFEPQAFYRLRTERTGDVYVAVNGATANIQLMNLKSLLSNPDLTGLISSLMMAGVESDIQRVTIPDTGAGSCLSLIVDDNNHGLANDSFTGCPVAFDGRRMQLDRYQFGWQHPTNLWYSPTFSFDSAMRVNMSNWAYDPDMSENYSARRTCLDNREPPQAAPCRIPVLQLGILGMPDGTQVGISMAVQNLTTGTGPTAVSSNLLGLPDVGAIESDLGLTPGSIEIGVASVMFDWEIRFNALNDRGFTDVGTGGGCNVGPCFFVPNSEWLTWVYGVNPVDPGVSGGYDSGPAAASSPANDLIDRIFEAPEAPGSDDGTPPDAYFNTDILMSRLIDCDHNASVLDPSYTIRDYVGDTPQQVPVDNSVWRFYAPASLDPSATIKAHLPPVPTVAEINGLGLTGANFTFESEAETGVPNGFELEWALNAANLPTNTTMQNILIRDQMLFDVRHASQNHQRFIF